MCGYAGRLSGHCSSSVCMSNYFCGVGDWVRPHQRQLAPRGGSVRSRDPSALRATGCAAVAQVCTRMRLRPHQALSSSTAALAAAPTAQLTTATLVAAPPARCTTSFGCCTIVLVLVPLASPPCDLCLGALRSAGRNQASPPCDWLSVHSCTPLAGAKRHHRVTGACVLLHGTGRHKASPLRDWLLCVPARHWAAQSVTTAWL